MEEARVISRQIGIPIEDIGVVVEKEARAVLKEARGDQSKIHGAILDRLREVNAITDKDADNLTALYRYAESSTQGGSPQLEASARDRYLQMIRDPDTTELACVLAGIYRVHING